LRPNTNTRVPQRQRVDFSNTLIVISTPSSSTKRPPYCVRYKKVTCKLYNPNQIKTKNPPCNLFLILFFSKKSQKKLKLVFFRSMDSSYQTGSWTNEKHVRFLNTMEASFVRAMFENNDDDQILRLDRYLPDSSESTLDLKKQRRKKHVSQGNPNGYYLILFLIVFLFMGFSLFCVGWCNVQFCLMEINSWWCC
jgi:hypothetical protein